MVGDIEAMAIGSEPVNCCGGQRRNANCHHNVGNCVSQSDSSADSSKFSGSGITLTFVVPAYNMEGYLHRCVDSLTATGAPDVEVIIVDDGSNDGTAKMADELVTGLRGDVRQLNEQADVVYPVKTQSNTTVARASTVRVIHQSNKGHGGAVNAGIAAASGAYVKVVDADDWVDCRALEILLEVLRSQCAKVQTHMQAGAAVRNLVQTRHTDDYCVAPSGSEDSPIDMVVTNYVYDKVGKRRKHVVDFRRVMKPNTRLSWDDLHRFGIAQYLIMHALTFRTDVLRQACTQLPEHTFYVDFVYAYQPLPWVRSLMYLNVPLYHYYIGREGQSVQTDMMVQRVDQLVHVNRIMDEATPERGTVPEGLYRYMIHFLSINSVVTSVFLILSRDPANYEIKRMLWKDMKRRSPSIAHDVRRQLPSLAINLPGATGRWIIRQGYRVANNIIGFN